MNETQRVCKALHEQGFTHLSVSDDEGAFVSPPEKRPIKTHGWKVLQRNRRWVAGCTITESVRVDREGGEGEQFYRRFTATIRGWQNFRIWEGYIDRPSSEIAAEVIAMVRAVRDRIDSGDESDFYQQPINRGEQGSRGIRKKAREMFAPGDEVAVTNHYITREDHPCFGTRVSLVKKVSSSGITLEPGGHTAWPKAADIRIEGDALHLAGHPSPGDRFLTITKATGEA